MSFRTLATYALFIIQALSVIANPVTATNGEELVRVPGGLIPKSNFHRVPEGGKIVHTPTAVHLIGADGTVLHSAPLTSSTPRYNVHNTPRGTPTIAPRNLQSAIVAAVAPAPSVSAFFSTWRTPPLPQRDSGQLLWYFSAHSTAAGDALIQPTLQYGVSAAGGGPFWTIASWFFAGDQAFVTNLTQVPSINQQALSSFIINDDQFEGTPTTDAWLSGFETFVQANLIIQVAKSTKFTTVFEALEIFDATTFSNLPSQSTAVDEISIQTLQDTFIRPIPWSFVNDTADGITMNNLTLFGDQGLFIKYPTF